MPPCEENKSDLHNHFPTWWGRWRIAPDGEAQWQYLTCGFLHPLKVCLVLLCHRRPPREPRVSDVTARDQRFDVAPVVFNPALQRVSISNPSVSRNDEAHALDRA